MTRTRYQYVQRHVSRHGKVTWYFRIGKGPRTRMPGAYGSEEFVEAHRRLLAGEAVSSSPEPEAAKNTLQWLVNRYEKSAAFKALAISTQKQRHNILASVCKTGGKLIISQITRNTIASGRDRRAETPFAAINFMKTMGYLFEWAVDAGLMKENPVRGVKRPKAKSDGHTPWTEDDVIQFYRHYPAGSQERVALELMLFTGLRRSDVYRIGPQHITDGTLIFRATKNGAPLYIPLHPILAASLTQIKTNHLAYLVTPTRQKPFQSAASFGNWFGDSCKAAGLSGRAHGIRKHLAQTLAEAGGSNAELKALFGWNSDSMAALYTKNADKRRLSISAGEKLKENILTPHPRKGVGENQNND